MPDTHGFQHLGFLRGAPEVACIDCDTRGPLHEWPEKKREKHARRHDLERRQREATARNERQLILTGETLDEGA